MTSKAKQKLKNHQLLMISDKRNSELDFRMNANGYFTRRGGFLRFSQTRKSFYGTFESAVTAGQT